MLMIIFCTTPSFEILTGGLNHIGILNLILATSISVSAPTATTATATAVIASNGDVSSITVTDAGLGYRTVPTVTISPPTFGSIPYQEIEFDDDWGIIKTIVSE